MRILYSGSTKFNTGPDNVNKGMIKNLTGSFTYIKSENKLLKGAEACLKCITSDVIVLSGVSKMNCLLVKLAKTRKKKTIYIMHGCVEYEGFINQQEIPELILQQERDVLEHADMLLPVSKKFQAWVQERYPQYADKTGYLFNGAEAEALQNAPNLPKIPGSVVTAGADRIVKNNRIVAQVIDKLDGKANLEICGYIYGDVSGEYYNYARYTGRLDHDEFIKKLAQADVYILNSIYEPFCLTAIEALACGCNVLISSKAGVVDVLPLEEIDIIQDPNDPEEIQRKLEYLLENPNHQRIFSKLDLDAISYKKSVERLEMLCEELLRGNLLTK